MTRNGFASTCEVSVDVLRESHGGLGQSLHTGLWDVMAQRQHALVDGLQRLWTRQRAEIELFGYPRDAGHPTTRVGQHLRRKRANEAVLDFRRLLKWRISGAVEVGT